MARPKKDNADYFSHDADMRNDNRIKAIRRKFGATGYAIWNMLLEHLTDCDFFEYEYNDFNIELLSGDFDLDPKLLKEIIDYFILLKLVVKENGTIKSLQHIKRFNSLLSKRKRDRDRVNAGENPQSKGEYSKVNKSIVEDSDNFYKINDLKIYYLDKEILVNAIIDNKKLKLKDKEKLEIRLAEFNKELNSQSIFQKTWHDYTSHFLNWHRKNGVKESKSTSNIPIG